MNCAARVLWHDDPVSVYLANLTTYYWLSPYFLVCVGILLILRREGVRDIATASAAWVSMAATIYVAIEMFAAPSTPGRPTCPTWRF
jgi:hypothetical protein